MQRSDANEVPKCVATNGIAPGVSQRFTVQPAKCRSGNLTGPIEDCEPPPPPPPPPPSPGTTVVSSWLAPFRSQGSSAAKTQQSPPPRRRQDGIQPKRQSRIGKRESAEKTSRPCPLTTTTNQHKSPQMADAGRVVSIKAAPSGALPRTGSALIWAASLASALLLSWTAWAPAGPPRGPTTANIITDPASLHYAAWKRDCDSRGG